MLRRFLGSLALVAAAAALVSCAEQQDPIDRTEAYALKKSLFSGEWYYAKTVVDVPGTKTVTFAGSTHFQGVYRIRWDIQEKMLYARRAYQYVAGAKNANPDTGEFKGAIVGAWPVTSHFDIKRSYNAVTGEENNVLTENASDCKWYDCKYMRVDFSVNRATDFQFLDYKSDYHPESAPFYAQDANDPRYKPVFNAKDGYIDFTNAIALKPGMKTVTRSDGSQVTYPLCFFFDSENAECNSEIIKIRHSFMRRHPNRDYEPRLHQGNVTEWFGYFDSNRLQWSNQYGVIQKTRRRYINRHNIWAKSHYDATATKPRAWSAAARKGAPKEWWACTKDSQCPEAGSRCDTLLPFHKQDIWTDSDADGLPDTFEKAKGLNANSGDTDGDGILDRFDDGDKNGLQDIQDYYAWANQNMEFRCTIPKHKRDPRPIVYFDSGFYPRALKCDKDDSKSGRFCSTWKWTANPKTRAEKWSVLHKISNDYDEAIWKVFLRGGYGCDDSVTLAEARKRIPGCFTQADYEKWIRTHKVSAFNAEQQKILAKFGTDKTGRYAWLICPNNPVQKSDPWPCRFPHKSFVEAQALMKAGKDKPAFYPKPRPGDIRYSQVHFAKDYYDGWRLLGYGPSHTDPRTGETLAGVANMYVLNDWAATYVKEMVQLLNGDIKPTDYIDGENVTAWVQRHKAAYAAGAKGQEAYDLSDLKAMYKSTVQRWMGRVRKKGTPMDIARLNQQMDGTQVRRKLIQGVAKAGIFDPAKFGGGIQLVKGTPLERQLVDNEALFAAGFGPAQVRNFSEGVLNKASPARNGWSADEAAEEWRFQLASRNNMLLMNFADDAMMGLAFRLKDKSGDEIWNHVREIIYEAVLTHELGHTMGLHHNWGGSEDVINFSENYWRLRTNDWKDMSACDPAKKTGLCPFFIKPMTDFQLGRDVKNKQAGLKAMYEYAYTSVMDYAGRYTIDGGGLGRYDKAAIMYGLGDKVEVFKNSGGIDDGNTAGGLNYFKNWFDTNGSPLYFLNSGPQALHYVNFFVGRMPTDLSKEVGLKRDIYKESNRMLVPYTEVKEVTRPGTSRVAGTYFKAGNKLYPRVPYIFCTYTRGDISDGCNTRDFGSDQYERMKMLVDTWDTWYPIRSFARWRLGFNAESYRGRTRRTYRRLKDFNNTYALYQGLLRQYYSDAQIAKFYSDPLQGWGAYTVAMNKAFNMAMRTLAMPDVKNFELGEEPDGRKIYKENVSTADFKTNINNGRYFTTSWSDSQFRRSCGLQWWECFHRVGFYVDKILALQTLTDARTYFVARDTAEDIRMWRISFFDNYTRQLVDFFGSVLSSDHGTHAPWYDKLVAARSKVGEDIKDSDGISWINGVAWRDYATPALDVGCKGRTPQPAGCKEGHLVAPSKGDAAVEPATRFTLQLYLAVLGMLEFHQNFDKQFIERGAMWKDGNGVGFKIVPTKDIKGTTKLVDPFTGATYVGVAYRDGRGIAQRMIAYANKVKARTDYCNKTPGQPDSCGPKFKDLTPKQKKDAESALYDYRQLMDAMVTVTARLRTQYNWSSNPFDPGASR